MLAVQQPAVFHHQQPFQYYDYQQPAIYSQPQRMSSQKSKRSSLISLLRLVCTSLPVHLPASQFLTTAIQTPKPTFDCFRFKIVCMSHHHSGKPCGMQAEYDQYYSVYGHFRGFDCEFDEVPKGAKFVDEDEALGFFILELDLCSLLREVDQVREILNRFIGDLCWRAEPLPPINVGKLLRALKAIGKGERAQFRFQRITWDLA
ncbi:hypothetical protein B0T14DRAFT_245747 [Immersiella caudata]|uniref:Uncharacterized protein n=1 Tax=Immersiella caudata TaxID=314043 RepID=A0AA39WJ72_9PEZI|nr:hypothetical protein B0T14DRAFT_245747 [Immersiella caudata]